MTPQIWSIGHTSVGTNSDSLIEHLICLLPPSDGEWPICSVDSIGPGDAATEMSYPQIVALANGWTGHRITKQGRALYRGSSSNHPYVDQTAIFV
jgi:hypothetical protein